MSTRRNFFFRQRVSEAELDSAFDDLEDADHNLAGDLGFTGVLANAVVSQHAPVADLTVDVSGPASILDQLGRRVFFSALQNVNVAQDSNGVATAVSAADKEKVVSVFVMFDRALSDPRVDGNSLTVFFRRDEAFKFVVVQGAEAAASQAVPPPLRSDAILLADVTRRFGQGQILNDVIATGRRQDAFVIAGAPRSLRRGRTTEVIADLLTLHNAHVAGSADHHGAAAIDYGGGGAWADGTANPATSVEAQLDKLVADLAGAGGAAKVMYAGGGAWKDGTANPATTVKAQLDKLVSDLAADAGAARLGIGARANWLDGRSNPAGVSILAAFNKIIADLSEQAADADGAARIGARASGTLAAGSVRSQLDAIAVTAVRTSVANVFSATQTVNGAAGDGSAALTTTAAPAIRKLLWQIAGAAETYNFRLYATSRTLEFTLNARWDGAQWVKDAASQSSAKFEINNTELRFNSDQQLITPFPDQWANTLGIGISGHGQQSFDAGGNWTSAGPTETYASWMGQSGNTVAIAVGAGASFRKSFPEIPSSITFTSLGLPRNITAFTPFAPTRSGTGVAATVAAPNTETFFFARVVAV